ncbi:DNA-binding domain-containing protein [Tahibacter amnicola]|uniref:DNA-binding domain-containing protein n=1 Tax=Tahibacter amnicola TaxID=2976241 RepID=A0ABY6BDG8_9GAMM|nr:putative DNA-binding domain-containing protein [Tahibacter amnicola]UXI67273.1 putative DNA-binding domain-containing protein [Tahibacter amnicola]
MPPVAEAGYLRALQFQFARAIREPESAPLPPDVPARRMAVYQELFFNNVDSLLSANFPVIRTLHDDAAWKSLVRSFLATHRCQIPLFPEFGREFLKYLEDRQAAGSNDPPFLLELAHYEWAELALSIDEHAIDAVPHDAGGDVTRGIPVVSPLAWLLAYRFPVHRIRPEFQPDAAPAEPTLLLLIRGRDDRVSFLEINAITAALFERLQENARCTGLEVLDTLLHEVAPGAADALRQGGIQILHDLAARHALLGTHC